MMHKLAITAVGPIPVLREVYDVLWGFPQISTRTKFYLFKRTITLLVSTLHISTSFEYI